MEILDCTLRDGGHALKGAFSIDATVAIIEGLLQSGVKVIEFGRPSGIGSPKGTVDDASFFEATQQFFNKGELGMFCRPDFFGADQFELACQHRIGFLRVGTNAAHVEPSRKVVGKLREAGIKVRYSLVQAHCIPPVALAENAIKVADYGVQSITIMDSTGTMLPSQVWEYVDALVNAVEVPVGFHGHNNLGFSVANALSAANAGALSLDGALGGLARSAGNAPTEILCTVLEKQGIATGVDFFELLKFIDEKMLSLVPDMKNIPPIDIIFGYAGFHSRHLDIAKTIALNEGVDLYRLIVKVMRFGEPNPDEVLFRKAARELKL